jgi:hypothetical protein
MTHTRRELLKYGAAIGSSGLLLAGCAPLRPNGPEATSSPAGVPRRGSTLRIGRPDDIVPAGAPFLLTAANVHLFTLLYDTLVTYDAKLSPVPKLATRWEWTPDARRLTLTLRPGPRAPSLRTHAHSAGLQRKPRSRPRFDPRRGARAPGWSASSRRLAGRAPLGRGGWLGHDRTCAKRKPQLSRRASNEPGRAARRASGSTSAWWLRAWRSRADHGSLYGRESSFEACVWPLCLRGSIETEAGVSAAKPGQRQQARVAERAAHLGKLAGDDRRTRRAAGQLNVTIGCSRSPRPPSASRSGTSRAPRGRRALAPPARGSRTDGCVRPWSSCSLRQARPTAG